MTLPKNVVKQDHDLEQDYEAIGSQLMELRWHWTLDESNPDRVSITAYAKAIGRSHSTIHADVYGWADSLADDRRELATGKTFGDYRELAKLGAEKKQAVEAIAKHTGKRPGTIAQPQNREEVATVVNRARDRAERRGTRVEDEIEHAAEWRAKAQKANAAEREDRKRKRTAQMIKIEGKIGQMIARGREILAIAEDVEFNDDEREIMADTLGKLRALLHLIDIRIAGETNIDWDAEFEKIAK